MKRGIAYGLFALAAYLVFLLAQLPATQVYGRLAGHLSLPVTLYGLSGTLWDGRARVARWKDWRLEDLHWQLRPQALLLGRMEAALAVKRDEARLEAIVGRAWKGGLYLRDGHLRLPLAMLEALVSREPLGLAGEASLDLERLEIAPGRIVEASGVLNITGAGLAPPIKVTVGDFRVRFQTTAAGVIEGHIKDTGGPLQAQGLFRLQPDGRYRLTAELAARDPKRSDLRQALATLGTPSPTGKVSLVRSGRLPLGRWLGGRTED